jgi:hypothetical protein
LLLVEAVVVVVVLMVLMMVPGLFCALARFLPRWGGSVS